MKIHTFESRHKNRIKRRHLSILSRCFAKGCLQVGIGLARISGLNARGAVSLPVAKTATQSVRTSGAPRTNGARSKTGRS